MQYFRLFIFISLFIVTGSCSSKTQEVSSGDFTEDESVYEQDSLDSKEEINADTVEIKPVEKVLSFTTSEEAIEYMRNSTHWDSFDSGLLPQMAKDHLPYATKLLNNKFDYFIVVDKGTMKLYLCNKYGVIVKKYGIACGRKYGTKIEKGDCRTAEGYFEAMGIYDSTDWLYTDDNGHTSPIKGQFGPRYIRFRPGLGIHGTCAPGSIGGRRSHGCVRLKNENILDLVKYAKKGMPIIVNPSRRDMEANIKNGKHVANISVVPNKSRSYISDSEAEEIKKKSDAEEKAKSEAKKDSTSSENTKNKNTEVKVEQETNTETSVNTDMLEQ